MSYENAAQRDVNAILICFLGRLYMDLLYLENFGDYFPINFNWLAFKILASITKFGEVRHESLFLRRQLLI